MKYLVRWVHDLGLFGAGLWAGGVSVILTEFHAQWGSIPNQADWLLSVACWPWYLACYWW